MSMWFYVLIAFAVAFAVGGVATKWLLKICYRYNIYDEPNARKIHKSGIPRLGGIMFMPTMILSLLITYGLMHQMGAVLPEAIKISSVLTAGAALLLYSIGILDDLTDCKASVKFLIQLLVIGSFVARNLYIDSLYGFFGVDVLPLWVAYPLTIFVGLLIVNAINLIDGIDGLAATLSLIALVVYGCLFGNMPDAPVTFPLIAAALSGALMVFLCFNIFGSPERHTKIFMGDSGSLLLGVVLTYFTLKYAMTQSGSIRPHADGLIYAYSLLLVPCFDLCRVAVCRLMRGNGIFEADKTHIHHKIMATGLGMRAAYGLICLLQVVLIVLNVALFRLGVPMEIIVVVDVVIYTLINVWLPNPSAYSNHKEHNEGVDWKAKLDQSGSDSLKICILTPRFPFPENGGDVLRINNVARYLRGRGHHLVLVSLCESYDLDLSSAENLYQKVYTIKRSKVESVIYSALSMLSFRPIQSGYYYSPRFKKLLQEVILREAPNLYVSHLLRMTRYLDQLHLEHKTIVEMTDSLSKTYSMLNDAKGSKLKSIIYTIERGLIKQYEKYTIHKFPKVVLVSQTDIDYLKDSIAPEVGVSLRLHSNGVYVPDASKVAPSYDANKICFIGNMRTLQNQDAVHHFVNNIFPIILKSIPDVRFYIVGAEPPQNIRELDDGEHVFVTGFVESLEVAISDCCLAVAPIRVAAGIQNKVLVAMSMNVPVVLSSLIAKAIPELHHGENCFIEDYDVSFAEAVIRLMREPSLRHAIGSAGKKCIANNYSWGEKLMGYETL